jgi:hypothetical protein
MALGRQGERQGDLVVTWKEMPRRRAMSSMIGFREC